MAFYVYQTSSLLTCLLLHINKYTYKNKVGYPHRFTDQNPTDNDWMKDRK